ncbi:transglycosylase SLT domain-containing protein [Spirulina sp. CS-785/01]|uniref:lytic transglycosylase domain-containing protein n=1 Tax=Spirulina sp. CS-785/01 TaxID=3021716 RepID=UPI00232CEE7F|nr:transglycosylase SLT domain-containing protein [Spirulina sp. CS-785/01]MDB9313300.1 transglycosylase SLT domain-containing protein [Spirulina sp. CS-785/01]
MQKGRTKQTFLTVSTGVVILALLGAGVVVAQQQGWWTQIEQWVAQTPLWSPDNPEKPENEQSQVLPLVSQSPEERAEELEAIALRNNASFERSRARYLLATDQLAAMEGGQALRLLSGLELEYPVLAPYILLKRARAYELTNELDNAKATLEQLISNYPDSLAVAEAYYQLGEYEPEYWEAAIAEYPHHPRTHEIVRQKLDGNLDQPQLLLFLVQYTPEAEEMGPILQELTRNYSDILTSEDWEAIANIYWEQWQYAEAGNAYAKAPPSSKTLYRAARGREIGGNTSQAAIDYQNLLAQYPNSEEAPKALSRLAAISPPQEALDYLNQIIAQYPQHAPDALLTKANLLENQLQDGNGAGKARQTLLSQYPSSEAASRYRWQMAQKQAEAGNYVEAWKWAHPIAINTPDSGLAPKASFWVGKWAARLDYGEDAEAAFNYVISQHPESYYAWRSASLLGWEVGTFTTVRNLTPPVAPPEYRSTPPAGSALFKELYQLGQDEDVLRLWYAEMGQQDGELTVPQQFTEGLVLAANDDYINGITSIWSLKERGTPAEKQAWQALRETPQYWQALFPFPYQELILQGAQQNQLNPLLVVSLVRQESRFEPDIRSSAGALGLMQVMPDTADWIVDETEMSEEYSLTNPEDNIRLGTWFLAYTHRQFNNNSLLAIASYNAGPSNVNNWVQRFGLQDPDEFVEEIPFPETKGYVETVFGNYWNYLRLYNPDIANKVKLASPQE